MRHRGRARGWSVRGVECWLVEAPFNYVIFLNRLLFIHLLFHDLERMSELDWAGFSWNCLILRESSARWLPLTSFSQFCVESILRASKRK